MRRYARAHEGTHAHAPTPMQTHAHAHPSQGHMHRRTHTHKHKDTHARTHARTHAPPSMSFFVHIRLESHQHLPAKPLYDAFTAGDAGGALYLVFSIGVGLQWSGISHRVGYGRDSGLRECLAKRTHFRQPLVSTP